MSAPFEYIWLAIALPFAWSVNEFAYWDWTLASGLAAFTPAINPYLKVSITGNSIPPINPTLFVLVVLPAIKPAKYADSSALNNILFTLLASFNSSSTNTKFCSGYNSAPSFIASANFIPTPSIKSTFSSTNVSIFVA